MICFAEFGRISISIGIYSQLTLFSHSLHEKEFYDGCVFFCVHVLKRTFFVT